MARARHGSYLFQRPGSTNWHVKLRSGGKRIERSLGTSDRRQAEILALPMIAEHKAALLAARPRIERVWVPKYKPGLHADERLFATEREVHHLDANGETIRTEANGGLHKLIIDGNEQTLVDLDAFLERGQAISNMAKAIANSGIVKNITPDDVARAVTQKLPDLLVPRIKLSPKLRSLRWSTPKVPIKGGDDAYLETYLNHSGLKAYDKREAEATWHLYKELTHGKPLKEATRDDGRKLVKHFADKGNKSATIARKVAWLRAAVELAINEGKLKFNPFANIVPKAHDQQVRLPLDDADMKACRRRLDTLTESDALLFRLLASTGMRLSEAFQIDGEATERGVRYVIIGKKTEQSKRRVPLPAAVLQYLPKKITGHLFGADTREAHRLASRRLNCFLNDCGINDPRKVVHSLRHRAQDRLRAAGCPQDIREALLGHTKVTVGESYGKGHPVPMLRKWIDKIGC